MIPRTKESTFIITVHIDDSELLMKLFHDSGIPGKVKIYNKPVIIQVKDLVEET